jgi:hypothetical protein
LNGLQDFPELGGLEAIKLEYKDRIINPAHTIEQGKVRKTSEILKVFMNAFQRKKKEITFAIQDKKAKKEKALTGEK